MRDNVKDAKSCTCKRVRDGLIDGMPDVTLEVDGGKTHSTMRYEYSNVSAPAGAK